MSSTQDYLKKYMSKPASVEEHKKRKLKKKKAPKSTVKKGNFAIHDEDEVSWKNVASESEDDCKLVPRMLEPPFLFAGIGSIARGFLATQFINPD